MTRAIRLKKILVQLSEFFMYGVPGITIFLLIKYSWEEVIRFATKPVNVGAISAMIIVTIVFWKIAKPLKASLLKEREEQYRNIEETSQKIVKKITGQDIKPELLLSIGKILIYRIPKSDIELSDARLIGQSLKLLDELKKQIEAQFSVNVTIDLVVEEEKDEKYVYVLSRKKQRYDRWIAVHLDTYGFDRSEWDDRAWVRSKEIVKLITGREIHPVLLYSEPKRVLIWEIPPEDLKSSGDLTIVTGQSNIIYEELKNRFSTEFGFIKIDFELVFEHDIEGFYASKDDDVTDLEGDWIVAKWGD
jgi:hypothetical protein